MKIPRAQKKLDQLKEYIEKNPDQRFFQAVTNCFGFSYLGKAETPDGIGFRDLWHEE